MTHPEYSSGGERYPYEQYGPFHTADRVAAWYENDQEWLRTLTEAGELIAGDTPDRGMLYPTWQFETSSGIVKKWVGDVMPVLARRANRWAAVAWLKTPSAHLADMSAVDWLNNGGHLSNVLRAANIEFFK